MSIFCSQFCSPLCTDLSDDGRITAIQAVEDKGLSLPGSQAYVTHWLNASDMMIYIYIHNISIIHYSLFIIYYYLLLFIIITIIIIIIVYK